MIRLLFLTFMAFNASCFSRNPAEFAGGQNSSKFQTIVIQRFPEIGVAGSEANKRFLAAIADAKKERPSLFDAADWPMQIALETESLKLLKTALSDENSKSISREAMAFKYSDKSFEKGLNALGVELSKVTTELQALLKGTRLTAETAARLRRNAETNERYVPFNPTDTSSKQRAMALRREADDLEAKFGEETNRLMVREEEILKKISAISKEISEKEESRAIRIRKEKEEKEKLERENERLTKELKRGNSSTTEPLTSEEEEFRKMKPWVDAHIKRYGHRPDAKGAYHGLKEEAEEGSVEAQFFLGLRLSEASDHGADKELASLGMHWLGRASEQGHPLSQMYLGLAHINGLNGTKNLEIGALLLRKAAQRGLKTAKKSLAEQDFSGLQDVGDEGAPGKAKIQKDEPTISEERYVAEELRKWRNGGRDQLIADTIKSYRSNPILSGVAESVIIKQVDDSHAKTMRMMQQMGPLNFRKEYGDSPEPKR